jgi:hypothetical protein
MFKPSASPLGSTTRSDIWVPINAYNWTWSGAAQSSGGGTTWTLVPGSDSSDPAASLMNAPMPVWTSYLTWTANAADQLNNWIK